MRRPAKNNKEGTVQKRNATMQPPAVIISVRNLLMSLALFASLPDRCSCGDGTAEGATGARNCTEVANASVKCVNADVAAIDLRSFVDVRHLTIRNSSLRELTFLQEQRLPGLQSLDVSQNLIENLDHDVFADVPNVTFLNLSRNSLSYIYSTCLTHLSSLTTLDLTHNKLLGPSAGAFQALPALAKLYLSHNPKLGAGLSAIVAISRRLTELKMRSAGLHHVPEILTRSVRLLDLAGNQLQEILNGDFDSYPFLRHLDLSDNLISYIQDDALGRLDALHELDLSRNHLNEIATILPSDLRFLNLSSNFINTVNAAELSDLVHLETLDLSHNELRAIPALTLPQLVLLRIEGNGLITLGDNFLINFPRLLQLKAAGNNLTCEEANWLAVKIQLSGVDLRQGCWNLTTADASSYESIERSDLARKDAVNTIITNDNKKKVHQENISVPSKKPTVFNASAVYKLKIIRSSGVTNNNSNFFARNLNNSEIIRIRPTAPTTPKTSGSRNTPKDNQFIKILRVNKPRRQLPINNTRVFNATRPFSQRRVDAKDGPLVKTSALVEHPPEKSFAGHPGLLAVLGTVAFLAAALTALKLFRDRRPSMSDKRHKCQTDLLQMDLLRRNEPEIDLW